MKVLGAEIWSYVSVVQRMYHIQTTQQWYKVNLSPCETYPRRNSDQ